MEREEAEKIVDDNWNEGVNEEGKFYAWYWHIPPKDGELTNGAGGMKDLTEMPIETARKELREELIKYQMGIACPFCGGSGTVWSGRDSGGADKHSNCPKCNPPSDMIVNQRPCPKCGLKTVNMDGFCITCKKQVR